MLQTTIKIDDDALQNLREHNLNPDSPEIDLDIEYNDQGEITTVYATDQDGISTVVAGEDWQESWLPDLSDLIHNDMEAERMNAAEDAGERLRDRD